jgi:hypothetical protein
MNSSVNSGLTAFSILTISTSNFDFIPAKSLL